MAYVTITSTQIKNCTLQIKDGYNNDVGYTWSEDRKTITTEMVKDQSYAFHYCEGLEKVSIPNSVRVIGAEAFQNCTGLTSITIPNSVDSIAHNAFYNCIQSHPNYHE